jgi:gluconolactonase
MAAYDIVDERFRSLVLPNADLELLGDGFRWLEGPVWFGDHQCLLFSDLPNDRVMRWSTAGVSVFRQPAGYANGHTRDRQGRLITCQHQHRRIVRCELDGRETVLVERYKGKRLNSPNDVVCASDGAIWFTDPHYGINTDYEGGKQEPELPPSVYRLGSDGQLDLVTNEFLGPNGLAFSPDERQLYISESGTQFAADPDQHIRVFDVERGSAQLNSGRIFCHVNPGFADGFKIDQGGNLWTSAEDGVQCFASDGTLLGRIHVPYVVSNLAFGDRHASRLFICASHSLFAIYINQRGCPMPLEFRFE